jgi:hypothetical protein
MVLTVDADSRFGGRGFVNATEAYRALSGMTERVLKRLRRMYPDIGSSWVATVEAHKSGKPHLNLVCHAPELARYLARDQRRRRPDAQRDHGADWKRHACRLRGELRRHVHESGWGPIGTAEPARDKNSLASYITKLAGAADKAWSEIAKLTQAPLNAPVRFRRLRSGKGFLPPRHSNPETTGALVRTERNRETGDIEVKSMNVAVECQAECDGIAEAELQIIEALEDARAGPWAVDVPHALTFNDPSRIRERLKTTPKHLLCPAGILPA